MRFGVIAAAAIISIGILQADEEPETDKRTNNALRSIIMDSCENDTIDIPCDTYVNSSTVKLIGLHDVCIRFEPGTQVLLDDVYLNVIELVNCSNIDILNGYFRHLDPLEKYDCQGGVIIMEGCSDITIDNCIISGCGAVGFKIVDSENIDIQHCLIEDNSFSAFYLWSFHNLNVNHCIIRNNGYLTYSCGIPEQSNLIMRSNLIYGNNSPFYGPAEIPGLRE